MHKNIVYAFRNIIKNKLNSFITVTGLSVAFACLLIIFLYVSQEFSYNNFHENRDKIYRVNYSINWVGGDVTNSALLNHEISKTLKDKVPQVEYCTAYKSAQKQTMSFKHQNLEETLCITEPDFFDLFSFKVLYGNSSQFLKNPDEVIITESLAKKLVSIDKCNIEDLVGQTVSFMNSGDQTFTISGILKDVPKNSTLQFSALIPYEYGQNFSSSSNMVGKSNIYYQLKGLENIPTVETQIGKVVLDYNQDLIDRFKSYQAFANTDNCFQPFMISFRDTHLSKLRSDYEVNNSKTSLYLLSVIGLLILIIAGSNFLMLSLGQAFKKMGEVGIRNTLGARKVNIFNIFFSENLIVTMFSFLLGAVLCVLLLPVFKNLAPTEIYTNLINIPAIVVFVLGCLLLITLITSILPVLKFVNIQPGLLASKKTGTGRRSGITQIFVTLQYGLSVLLIILTILVVRQTNYMKYKDLGFSSENMINLRIYHLTPSEKLSLRDRLSNHPGVINLTLTDRDYLGGRSSDGVKKSNGESVETRLLSVDQNYIPTLGLTLIAGENFKETSSNDQAVIVNQKLLAELDRRDDAVGSTIMMSGVNLQIKGVIKNYNFDSSKEAIMPLILRPRTIDGSRSSFLLLRYTPEQLASLLPFIRKTWKEITPDKELDLNFWDDQLNNRYQSEEQWSRIIGYAALIAIILSSLGLFGLTLMSVNTRKKEIGIRKINGARITEVMSMLNQNFIKWVVLAFIVAMPVSYYACTKWLENFAYKTTISWWIFVLAGAFVLTISLLTVSFQSYKAAVKNPVEALRYE